MNTRLDSPSWDVARTRSGKGQRVFRGTGAHDRTAMAAGEFAGVADWLPRRCEAFLPRGLAPFEVV